MEEIGPDHRTLIPPHHLFSPRHRALESEIIAGLLGVDNAEHTKYVKPPPTIV